jgi:hypothetical protein
LAVTVEKVFRDDERNFSGPLMRSARCERRLRDAADRAAGTNVAHLSRGFDILKTGIASLVVAGYRRYRCVAARNISIAD